MPREAEPVVPEIVMQWDGDLSIFVQDTTHHVQWSYVPDHDRGGYVDVGMSGRFATVSTDDEEGTAHFPAPLARLIARKLLAIADAIYPEPAPASPAPSASSAENQEKCGECAFPLIPRRGEYFACVLPKGHEGEHRGGGTCFKHGAYIGEPNQAPQCPHWPTCVADLTHPAQPQSPSLSTLRAQIEGLPRYEPGAQSVKGGYGILPMMDREPDGVWLSRSEVLALFDALTNDGT